MARAARWTLPPAWSRKNYPNTWEMQKRIALIGAGLMGSSLAKHMLEVLKKSVAFSKIMDQKGTRMVNRQFLPPAGHMAVFRKDVQLMLDLGARLDCPLPLISFHAQALASEISKGRGDWDTSAIISFYDGIANIQ
jgi:3-hydroxyisobutyrate dehydrogenase-like beta-hydroxyacid dehydrogenase